MSAYQEYIVGPGTAVLNSVPRFASTDGQTLEDSLVLINDDGDITTPGDFIFGGSGGQVTGTLSTTLTSVVLNSTDDFHVLPPTVFEGNVEFLIDANFTVSGGTYSLNRSNAATDASGTAQLTAGVATITTAAANGNYTVWISPISNGGGSITNAWTVDKNAGSFNVVAVAGVDDFNFDWEIHYYNT